MSSKTHTVNQKKDLLEGPTSSILHFLFAVSCPTADGFESLSCSNSGGIKNIELLLNHRYGFDVDLSGGDTRIPVRIVSDLANWLSGIASDPLIGIHWMVRGKNKIILEEWRSIKYVATSAMEYFELVMRYHRLYSELLDFKHDIRDSEWTLFIIDNDPGYTSYHLIDGNILMTMQLFKGYFNSDPKRIELSHACPKGMGNKYEKYYGCEVVFNSDNNKIVYHSSEAIKPVYPKNKLCRLGEADNKLAKYLSNNSSEFVKHESFVQQAEFWIERLLMRGEPSCEQVAKHMAVSIRTMQRKLKRENTSFLDILDKCRKGLCEKYLRDSSLRVTDIAWLLGYVDASQFYRAFQRWMGMPMIEYRKQIEEMA